MKSDFFNESSGVLKGENLADVEKTVHTHSCKILPLISILGYNTMHQLIYQGIVTLEKHGITCAEWGVPLLRLRTFWKYRTEGKRIVGIWSMGNYLKMIQDYNIILNHL